MSEDAKIPAPFIVIEGLDGAGTTTQAHRLVDRLRAEGRAALFTCEPSSGPIGAMIRQMLAMRIVAPAPDGAPRGYQPVDRQTLALLFAADRLDHVATDIEPALHAGTCVVSDRYYHSSFAYQGDVDGEDSFDIDWVRALNARARRPDLTFFLEADVELCLSRLGARLGDAGRRDIYETEEKLTRLARRYEQIMATLEAEGEGERIVRLDASGSIEAIGEAIWQGVRETSSPQNS